MRFWITKNSEIPLRDQLVRQVWLGILSEDLPAGQKLPSVRTIARRHHIHANTVSAAYHDLLQQGWLELRQGSGLYVRSRQELDGQGKLDQLLLALLKAARTEGHEPEEVLRRLEGLVKPHRYERILIAEPEPAMREILHAELSENLNVPLDVVEQLDFSSGLHSAKTLVVALPTRATKISRSLPPGLLCIPLRVRSVGASLEGETKPGPEVMISIVSRSPEIRYGARALLIAVGVDPMSLCEIDATEQGWRDRIGRHAYVVTDIVTARELPAGCDLKVYRVIADSCMSELQKCCSAGRTEA